MTIKSPTSGRTMHQNRSIDKKLLVTDEAAYSPSVLMPQIVDPSKTAATAINTVAQMTYANKDGGI